MAAILTRKEEVHALRLARSQPESLAELGELAQTLRGRVIDIALADRKVRSRLRGVRSRVLTVDYREEKGREGQLVRFGDVCIYDYDRNVLVVAAIDARTGRVADVLDRQGAAPPISNEERAEALQIAEASHPSGKGLRKKSSGTVAFPSPSYAFDAEPERRGHRGCTLFFRAGRGSVGAITVDLSAREVVPEDRLPVVLRSRPARVSPQPGGSSDAR